MPAAKFMHLDHCLVTWSVFEVLVPFLTSIDKKLDFVFLFSAVQVVQCVSTTLQ